MFSNVFILSLTLFIFAFRQNRNISKMYQKKIDIDNALDLL